MWQALLYYFNNMSKAKANTKLQEVDFSKKQLLDFYTKMVKIRRFEEKSGQLYGMGLIGGFCHLYIGQEAVVVGIQENSKKGDQIITTYRDHGHMIAADTDPYIVFAELLGKADGCSRGKGGSMHMFDLENHFYGGHGIVGANVPIGTGLAFANKYRGNDFICIDYFGDGAANQGQVYESFNMAALWDLPVLYVIENNGYAMGTAVKRSSAMTELYKRGSGFDVAGDQCNGMDVCDVSRAAKKAIDYVRNESKPFILEVKTYRYRGHSMSDPAKYRTKEEVEDYKKNYDPITSVKNLIISCGFETEEKLKQMDKDIKAWVSDAAERAKTAPEPELTELYTDVLND